MFNNGLYPSMNYGTKAGLFSAFKKFNWGSFLSNTQKTLGVINQAIPIAYQIKPIWNNTKTVFRIMGALKDDGKKAPSLTNNNNYYTNYENNDDINYESSNQIDQNQPSFFL